MFRYSRELRLGDRIWRRLTEGIRSVARRRISRRDVQIFVLLGGLSMIALALLFPPCSIGDVEGNVQRVWFRALLSANSAPPHERPTFLPAALAIELTIVAWHTAAILVLLSRGAARSVVALTTAGAIPFTLFSGGFLFLSAGSLDSVNLGMMLLAIASAQTIAGIVKLNSDDGSTNDRRTIDGIIERYQKEGAVPELARAVHDPMPYARDRARRALVDLDELAIVELGRMMLSDPLPDQRDAAYALGAIGDRRAVPLLMDAMRSQIPELQVAAFAALYLCCDGSVGSRMVIDRRRENPRSKAAHDLLMLFDPNSAAASEAAEAEGNGNTHGRNGTDDEAWHAASKALADHLKRRDAVRALINALSLSPSWLRSSAAEALGALQAPEAVRRLIDTLEDGHAYVRTAAAEALGKIGDSAAIDALRKAGGDTSSSVRRAASQALQSLENSPGRSLLRGATRPVVSEALLLPAHTVAETPHEQLLIPAAPEA